LSTGDSIDLAVLDWAGTVVDFGCLAPTGAFVQAFAEAGVEATWTETRRPMGLHKKDHIREMLRDPSLASRWKAANGKDWSEADVDSLYLRVTPLQVKAATEHADLVPGTLDAIADLRQRGIKIAGSTGYFREAADAVAEHAAAFGYKPDFNIGADDVPAGRPAPWMIFRSMEHCGVFPPHRVVKVGDTLVDIEDGRNAGVWSVGVVESSNEMGLSLSEWTSLLAGVKEEKRRAVRERFLDAGADAVIDSIAGLPGLIDDLNRRLQGGTRPGR